MQFHSLLTYEEEVNSKAIFQAHMLKSIEISTYTTKGKLVKV